MMIWSSSSSKRYTLLPVLLLLLAAGLLYTGSSGFRVRDTAGSDICHSTNGRCTSSGSSSSLWTPAVVRGKGGFEKVSTRGGFVKPPQIKEDDEEQVEEKIIEKEQAASKWKDRKRWSKLKKIEDEKKENISIDDNEDEKKVDSDDELIQIEVEEDDEVVIESDEENSEELLEREEEKRKKDENKKRLEEERKKEEEIEKRKKEEEEKKRKDKELEEQRKRKEEEQKRKEKELEERRKKEEVERKIKEETERRRQEQEDRRRKEEERKRKEEEERQRKEEERKHKEEEDRRRKEEQERKHKEEEERRRKEEERKYKEEEEQRRKEEQERKRKEEERKRKEELERKRKEEEERIRKEKEQRLKEEEERRMKEEEERQLKEEEERRLKEEEECRLAEEQEQRLKELEELRLKEEEERKKREKKEKEAERKQKEEEARKKKELEIEKKRKQKEEEERLKREKEEKEAERKRDAEEDKKRVERLKREAQEKKMREEEERKKRLKSKKNKVEDSEDEDEEAFDDDGDSKKDKFEKLNLPNKEKTNSVENTQPKPSTVKKTVQSSKTKPIQPIKQSIDKKLVANEIKTISKEKGGVRGGPEAQLSLAELNDMILSVPTFVPNFTALEDSACQQHGKIFLRQLRGYKLWALQMLDSSAKIPAGLLRGNVNQLGDFDQCLGVLARVKVDEKTIKVQGKYCLASVDLYAAHPATKMPVNLMQSRALIRGNIRDPGHFVPRFTTSNWAVCLPSACSAEDARKSIENALNYYNSTVGIKFMVKVDSDMCYVKQKSQSYSKETIGVLYFYAMFVCLAIVATLRDYFTDVKGKGNYSERIIMSFSLKRTLKALFGHKETSYSDIGCIHGIRTLSTAALYVAHKLIPTSRIPYANRISLTEAASHPLSLILRASLFYTDSFLLMSGVLTAYNMANELSNRGEIRWFCRLIARYMRLTPSLLAVVFWYGFVMEHTGSGPQWNAAVKTNSDICKKNAWINLLYVQNFFPFEEMCATHTHQLALDMQLSLAAPALVFFLQIKPIIGMIVVFFLLQVSATLRYLATSNNNLSLVIFHGMTIKHLYKTANLTYILPLHRATPYLFGVSLGVILHYTGKNIRLNKIVAILGWLIALALGMWSIFSPWRLARRDYVYNVEDATHYAVVSPILTALALCWVIFACFTENGGFINKILSNYWMVVLSKLSYAIYLSQFAVFFYNVGTTRYSSEFHPFRALDPIEVLTVILASVVLTLLFDIPMQEVKNIIMECSDYQTEETKKSTESSEENHNNVKKIPHGESIDEEPTTNWNWDRGTFTQLSKTDSYDYEESIPDEPPFRSSRLKRQDIRRQTITPSDTYDEWDSSRRNSRSEEPFSGNGRPRSEYRLSGTDLEDELTAENYLNPRERFLSRSYSRSPMRDLDAPILRRSISRERHVSAEPDIPLRDYTNKPLITISQDEDYQISRSPRSSVSRFAESQRSMSTESEFDLSSRRSSASFTRRSSIEPRSVDEDEWEEDIRLRRNRFFQDRMSSQEREHVPPPIVEEEVDGEWNKLKRRSSAEGKMALLKEPIRPGNIALWTVSKIQLGSSQEPDDEDLDEDSYQQRRRIEYREQGPPLREEFEGEDEELENEKRRKNFTGGSLPTSFEEEEDGSGYDFALKRDSKRITVQDLSRLSSEEDSPVESSPNKLDVKPGLIKRESIIKSQASEEDPEYMIPERPKLVEQEQEHPFKKAWHMQKSRSEEEGSAAFIIKELKSASTSLEKQDEEPEYKKKDEEFEVKCDEEIKGKKGDKKDDQNDDNDNEANHEGAQSKETCSADVSCDVTFVWQARTSETENDRSYSLSGSSSELEHLDEGGEEDQIDGNLTRRKSEEENWTWTEKDT